MMASAAMGDVSTYEISGYKGFYTDPYGSHKTTKDCSPKASKKRKIKKKKEKAVKQAKRKGK